MRERKGNKMKIRREIPKGITLIALVVTIVILIILATISINIVLGGGGLIERAREAKFKTKMSTIAEEANLYVNAYIIGENGIIKNAKNIYMGGSLIHDIIADEEIDVDTSLIQDIKSTLKNVGNEEEGYTIVFEGELYYVSQKKIKDNDKQVRWCEEIGIKIWEYTGSEGIKVVNGNYEKVNETYLCTPKLNTGFVKEVTRYAKEVDGNLVPGNWINKKPDDDWYDYGARKWANLYVESNGIESSYVWIPRYAYKIDTTKTERMDVKFVDINNNYTDGKTDETTNWAELQKQGYKVPEAFYYGDSENYLENTPIPGYWMSKYQLSELTDADDYTVDYSTIATPGTIKIQNIVTSTDKEIAKYVYAVNGKVLKESTTPIDYVIEGLAKGNKAVNVTLLDANGEVIGSMTKLYETADNNPPDLTGFDPDTTFYVYWDENGIEHNEIPISKEAPAEWYDYGIASWANILTRNNGVESYFVWIPRYQYALDTVSQRSYVRFIQGTGGATEPGYKVPEAFYFGDNDNYLENTPITGYWMSKYQLTEATSEYVLDAELSAGGTTILVKDITGTGVEKSTKYEYYVNGNKVHEGSSATENYQYTGLKANTDYVITIIARDASGNYVGGITKKIMTAQANAPKLEGYNASQTYYVLYDEAGNETIGDKIKNDGSNMPNNWYEYSQRKWANIVVTDGTVKNGKIEGGTYKNYFVWIPRYAYKLDTLKQRSDIKFIEGTAEASEELTSEGYKIPEAFYYGDNEDYKQNTPIPGYWMSKYQLSDN